MAACEGISCRKRARSDPDDCQDCMPISKRINNLHIRHSADAWEEVDYSLGEGFNNNIPGQVDCCSQTSIQRNGVDNSGNLTVQIPGLPFSISPQGLSPPDINHNNPLLSPLLGQQSLSNDGGPWGAVVPHYAEDCDGCYGYSPDMNEKENPHYFQINSTLYQAHVQRLQRSQPEGDPNT